MKGPHHLALGARDVERVSAFYREFFGLRELRRFEEETGLRSIWLELGQLILMVEATDSPARRVEGIGCGLFLISFAVDEAEREELEERLEGAGYPIESRTKFTSYTRDCEGNRIAFSLPVDPLLESG